MRHISKVNKYENKINEFWINRRANIKYIGIENTKNHDLIMYEVPGKNNAI